MNLFSEVSSEYCDAFYAFHLFPVFTYAGSRYTYTSVLS